MERKLYGLALFGIILASAGWNQEAAAESDSDATVLDAARKIMASAKYCGLVTLDETGEPHVRTMDPFPPDEKMTVRLGTNRMTRKIAHLRKDSRVSLYYFDPKGMGYVTISGSARVVDDPEEKGVWWKKEWAPFYRNGHRGNDYVLIEVRASRCEVMSKEYKVASDAMAWKPAVVVLH